MEKLKAILVKRDDGTWTVVRQFFAATSPTEFSNLNYQGCRFKLIDQPVKTYPKDNDDER
jgi:hypothetical protein